MAGWTKLNIGLALAALAGIYLFALGDPLHLVLKTVHRFRLEAHFTFDGKPYTAVGWMECIYTPAWFTVQNRPYPAKGPPINEGYYTSTARDSPSVVLPDGQGAILFKHGGTCWSLPQLEKMLAEGPLGFRHGIWQAFYFPDRHDPKTAWIIRTRRADQVDKGRLVLKQYLFIPTTEPKQDLVARNVPIAWQWYERASAQYRKGGIDIHRRDAWLGIVACLVPENVWRGKADFERAAADVNTISVVDLKSSRGTSQRNCPFGPYDQVPPGSLNQISLVPSPDYSRATFDLDRADLRWAAIVTPYVRQYRSSDGSLWAPKICVSERRCVAIKTKPVLWLYWPERRLFIRLTEQALEPLRFPDFAVRHGDRL